MPLPTYRVRLADGAIVFVDDLAYAKRTYPDAIIINRIVDGGMDNPVSEPYRGMQPGEKESADEAQDRHDNDHHDDRHERHHRRHPTGPTGATGPTNATGSTGVSGPTGGSSG